MRVPALSSRVSCLLTFVAIGWSGCQREPNGPASTDDNASASTPAPNSNTTFPPLFTQAAAAEPARSPEWSQWRGPTHDGIVPTPQLPDPWPSAELKPSWQAELRSGWSSPVLSDGRVFISDRDGNTERVLAFDAATGRLLWQRTNPVDFDPHTVGRRHGNGPKATPLVNAGKVYNVGIAGWLQCLEARDGSLLWKVNLPAEFGEPEDLPGGRAYVNREQDVVVPIGNGKGAPVPLFGYTGSPVLHDHLLMTPVGGAKGGTLIAFDKDSGRVKWKSLHENVSYSSPVVATLAGVTQLVVMTGPRIVGLDLTGRLLWSHPFQIQYDESIGTPLVVEDLVLATATGKPLTALRIAPQGNGFNASVAWENDDFTSYLSSLVARDGHAYGMDDGGQFHCVRLADGKTVWTGGNHGFYCTPLLAGDRLLALNERGDLLVVGATPDGYKPLGHSRLADSPTWTCPAVIGNRIYIRSGQGLAAFTLSARK